MKTMLKLISISLLQISFYSCSPFGNQVSIEDRIVDNPSLTSSIMNGSSTGLQKTISTNGTSSEPTELPTSSSSISSDYYYVDQQVGETFQYTSSTSNIPVSKEVVTQSVNSTTGITTTETTSDFVVQTIVQ